jgi:hypothetical protein
MDQSERDILERERLERMQQAKRPHHQEENDRHPEKDSTSQTADSLKEKSTPEEDSEQQRIPPDVQRFTP